MGNCQSSDGVNAAPGAAAPAPAAPAAPAQPKLQEPLKPALKDSSKPTPAETAATQPVEQQGKRPAPQPPSPEPAAQTGSSRAQAAAQHLESEKSAAAQVSKSAKSVTRGTKLWVIGETVDIRTVFEFSQVLGKGQFGTTRLATNRTTKEQVACKSISKRKLTCKEDIEDVQREVQILYHLSGHDNVVKMKAVYEDTQYVHILMEVANGGELFDRIVEQGYYSEKDAANMFRTMVGVIAHCHNMGVMHRDIKPENFLLSDKTKEARLIATDFGLSVFFKEGETFREIVGSAYYVAPEVLKRNYSKEADIWSLGVMLYILLSGVPPFYGETEAAIFQEVLTGKLDLTSPPWPSISEEAKQLVSHLLVRDPTKRLTAQEVLNNKWVKPGGSASDAPIQSEVVSRLQGFAKMNKLKKEALKLIASFLPENEIKGLREMFHAIDADGSGTITVAELKEALKKKGQLIPEDDVKNLVAATDVNGNGTIDYEEFLAATIHQSKLQMEENLYKAFQMLDTDGSGFIDREELVRALSKYGDLSDLDSILSQVDTNDDGQIDYEEFCAMMLSSATLSSATNKMAGAGGAAGGAGSGGGAAPSGMRKDRNDIMIDGDKVQVLH